MGICSVKVIVDLALTNEEIEMVENISFKNYMFVQNIMSKHGPDSLYPMKFTFYYKGFLYKVAAPHVAESQAFVARFIFKSIGDQNIFNKWRDGLMVWGRTKWTSRADCARQIIGTVEMWRNRKDAAIITNGMLTRRHRIP